MQWAEATREHAVRRELMLREAEDRAVTDPPEHVYAALGPRPEAGDHRERWNDLAQALERDRLEHQMDTEPHPSVAPERHRSSPQRPGEQVPSEQRARLELTKRVRDYRAERGLELEAPVEALSPEPDIGFEV